MEPLEVYMEEINRIPVLTAQEEHTLFAALISGDKTIRERLIESNLRLVVWVASHYKNRGLDLIDLIQYGNIALLRLVDSFAPEQLIRFSTYAVPRLRFVMLRAIRDHGRLVRLPWRQDQAFAKLKRLEEKMMVEDGVFNSIEVSNILGVEREEIVAWFNADRSALSFERYQLGRRPIGDRIPDDGEAVEDIACRRVMATQVKEKIATLPFLQQDILLLHYDLEQSYATMAKAMKYPRMALWRKEQEAVALLRREMELDCVY